MKKRFLRLLRLFISIPVALSTLTLIRIVRPLLLIRVGAVKTDRIGHFVLETELMILEQLVGIRPKPRRSFDLYYLPKPISNSQIERMWKREINVLPRWIMIPLNRLNHLIPGGRRHMIPSASSTALDVHNLLDSNQPLLRFSQDESVQGLRLLDEMGLERGKYVCVIARDAAYYKSALPEVDLSYHDYRNCDIDTYVEAMETLTTFGLKVVRMGALVEKPLISNNPYLIDYPNTRFRNDFADVYLAANCKFCVSDGLGFFALPTAFRRPNAFVNFAPFHMLYSSRSCDLGITKVFVDASTNTIVPLRELVNFGVTRLTRSELLAEAGLAVRANTPSQIRELVVEMNARIDGTWTSERDDEKLQHQFWSMFKRVVGDEGKKMHGEYRSRFGAKYLRDHRDWFTD